MSSERRRRRRSARGSGGHAARPGAKTRRTKDGRVHLQLMVDPASGRDRLTLARPVFLEEWQNRLVTATANTALAVLRRGATPKDVVGLARQSMASTSTLIDGLLQRASPGALACRAGCDHCCRQSVGVTPPELFAIVQYLARTKSTSELATLRRRTSELSERTRGLSSRQRLASELPCPLLEEGRCSVYEVRPLSCRGMNSLDARICEQKLQDGPTREAYFSGTLEGHVFIEPIRAAYAISAGLQLALSECFGLDMRPLDLTAALDLVLSAADEGLPASPEGDAHERSRLLSDWLLGRASLESARGGDASSNPNHLEFAGVVASGRSD